MNAFLPDIANIGQRLERLQHNPLFSDEDYTHLNEAVTRLEEFFKYHFSSRPIEGAYLVSSAFWLYFPMSLNCFEAVLPNITTFVPQEQLDMFQDDLNRRLELVREFANEYVGVYLSIYSILFPFTLLCEHLFLTTPLTHIGCRKFKASSH